MVKTSTQPTTKLGILGKSLVHSLSPEIHTYLLKKLNIPGNYQKYEITKEEVPGVIPMMIRENILGMNVTIPYKETLFHLVDEIDEHAQAIGAINTIKIKDGISYGYNTDYIGGVSMFKNHNLSLKDKNIVILGSGGATKALIYGFHLEGAKKITVTARNQKACLELKQQFPYIDIADLKELSSSHPKNSLKGDILVNTTPVGMFPNVDESPVSVEVLKGFSIACDIVYNPLMTKFLTLAKGQNLQVVTGLTMLIDQAIAAEEIWLERKIDYRLSAEIATLPSLAAKT